MLFTMTRVMRRKPSVKYLRTSGPVSSIRVESVHKVAIMAKKYARVDTVFPCLSIARSEVLDAAWHRVVHNTGDSEELQPYRAE
ncbi:hypothetical protein V7S43_000442 [Phytophthora oleae]|uniref:Uncharacterized protein n=1 Tax=Phytophthora oleae TaxID=2107226 RepID=A0ABD3GBG2_9STRA